MSTCQVSDVEILAVNLLGDVSNQITSDIGTYFKVAYGDLINLLNKTAQPTITREVYYTLPANTTVVDPAFFGVTDFAQPQQIWQRQNVSTTPITSLAGNVTPMVVTFSGAVPAVAQVELTGMLGVGGATLPTWLNRDWYITKTGSNTASLNGSFQCGISATGGSAAWSNDTFRKMNNPDYSPLAGPQTPDGTLNIWRWENGRIYVNACSVPTQLWIQYLASPNPPASGEIGLCDGRELNFLAYATGGRFGVKYQMVMGPSLMQSAYGDMGQPDGSDGLLRELIVPQMLQNQNVQRRSGLFRRRRNGIPMWA